MQCPSQDVKAFCDAIRQLLDSPRSFSLKDGFCQHETLGGYDDQNIVQRLPRSQQAHLINGLYWGSLVGEVLRSVLIRGSIPGVNKDADLYELFHTTYPFPKLYGHTDLGIASPAWFLIRDHGHEVPDRELLSQGKEAFWGEVAAWLTEIGRTDVRSAAEKAFREDIGRHIPAEYAYLFP